MVTERMRPVKVDGARPPPGRAPVPLGSARAHDRRRRERPPAHGARPERPHPGGEGVHVRHPPRAASARAASSPRSWPTCAPGSRRRRRDGRARDEHGRGWGSSPTRRSASAARRARSRARSGTSSPRTASTGPARATTTPRRSARTRGGTSPSSSSSKPLRLDGDTAALDAEPLRWLMESDVCKHCTHAGLPRRVPDRRRSSAPSSAPSSCRRTSATAAATASPPARSA